MKRTQTLAIFILMVGLVISGCGTEQSVPSLTPAPTPRPTPKPFTSPLFIGAWVGDISIPLDLNNNESANIRFLISANGKIIDYYQLYLTSCSIVVGDHGIPIEQGVFSFNIIQSCDFTGNISITGVFVAEDKLEGTIKVGSQISYWEATPAK